MHHVVCIIVWYGWANIFPSDREANKQTRFLSDREADKQTKSSTLPYYQILLLLRLSDLSFRRLSYVIGIKSHHILQRQGLLKTTKKGSPCSVHCFAFSMFDLYGTGRPIVVQW